MALTSKTGKLTYLRVQDVGEGFGAAHDYIDVEVIIRLTAAQDEAYGFQLRNDGNRAARQGMLDLLRDAYGNNQDVTATFDIKPGKKHGILKRVILQK